MSRYLVLAVKRASLEEVQSETNKEPFFVHDVSSTPIGHVARGQWAHSGCGFLLHSKGVVRLLGHRWLKRVNKAHPPELPIAIRHLVEVFDCEVAFIVHEFRGLLTEEPVHVKREVSIHVDRVESMMDQLEEDVRYVVFPAVPEGFSCVADAQAIKGDLKGELAEWQTRVDAAIAGSSDESELLQAIRSTFVSLLRASPGTPPELAHRVRDYVRTSNLILFYPPERGIE